MITTKQRAYLRGLASRQETIFQLGKDGLTDSAVRSVADALRARELVKGRVLDACPLTAREALAALSEKCGAEQVQAIGTRFVLYKRNEKQPKIELPKETKK